VQESGQICAWDGNSWVGLSAVAAIKPDVWVCLVFVFAFGELTLYVDGARQSQVACGWDFDKNDLVVGSLFLGLNGSWFQGEMEPPEMWAFAMCDSQVLALAAKTDAIHQDATASVSC
jgi:hypothetical protein